MYSLLRSVITVAPDEGAVHLVTLGLDLGHLLVTHSLSPLLDELLLLLLLRPKQREAILLTESIHLNQLTQKESTLLSQFLLLKQLSQFTY